MAKLEESPATIEQIETLKQLIEQWRALKAYQIKFLTP